MYFLLLTQYKGIIKDLCVNNKNLGLIIDCKLRFNYHVSHLIRKAFPHRVYGPCLVYAVSQGLDGTELLLVVNLWKYNSMCHSFRTVP